MRCVNMKKAIMLTVICLMSLILSGCMAGIANVTINEDGTIDIFSQMGVSETAINAMITLFSCFAIAGWNVLRNDTDV